MKKTPVPLGTHGYNQLIDAIGVGVICVGSDLRITLMNAAARTMLSVKSDPIGMLVLSVTRNVALSDALRDALTGKAAVSSTMAVGRSGKERKYSVSASVLYDHPCQDVPFGAYALIEDVTELLRLEQVRTDFAANVSHELKTPLTSIRGFLETLMDEGVERDAQLRFLSIMQFEAERLSRLIDDILSLATLESTREETVLEPIHMDLVMQQPVSVLRPRAVEKNIDLKLSVDKALFIMGQADQIQQMLLNIIDNAIKYTPDGGSVEVRAYAEGAWAWIDVTDTGIGLSPEHQARLFERFYRVDKGRSRAMGGTGLGLAIVKHIARSLNGEIDVISELGKGSTFRVKLPRIEKPE